jgi:hypothetical protein
MKAVPALSVAIVACLACVGCASGGPAKDDPRSPATSSASQRPPLKDDGRLSAEVKYQSGITLRPPQPIDRARVTPQDAYRSLCGSSLCASEVSATIVLARVTDLNSGTAEPDGSIKPAMDGRLVYVLRFDGEKCVPAGVIPGQPGPTPVPCSTADFIDAGTGKFIYAESGRNL